MTEREALNWEPIREFWRNNSGVNWDELEAAIKEVLAQPEQEPVALETVYETIIQWDEGGGKRSRRELARRIIDLCITPPQRKPLTDEQRRSIVNANRSVWHEPDPYGVIDDVEAAHGIKE